MIEQKVNSIVAEFIRIFGPTLLQSALGNRPKTGGGSPSQSLTASSTESPFKDDENNFVSTSNDGSKVSISLPTFPPDEDEGVASGTTSESTTINRGQDAANTVVWSTCGGQIGNAIRGQWNLAERRIRISRQGRSPRNQDCCGQNLSYYLVQPPQPPPLSLSPRLLRYVCSNRVRFSLCAFHVCEYH